MTLHERIQPGKYRLRIDDYACLSNTGIFGDAGTELIAGEIIVMSPEWRPHMRIKDELAYRLRRALEDQGSRLSVGTGGSVALDDDEMPRPDILVTDAIDGEDAVPGASVALIVEVSASTLDYDLTSKAAIYATADIAEYWVADVNGRVIHQMWAPEGGAYTATRDISFGEMVPAATIPDLQIATATL